jgi:hypothetical protein
MGTEIHTVLATADLHYGNRRDGDACAEGLAEFVSGHSADALAIAGDVADRSPESFRACLQLFSDFEGARRARKNTWT